MFCGNARDCECAKLSVASKVSKTKLLYSPETKQQINNKRINTNIERYGISNPFNDGDKIKNSYIEKLGVDNPNKLVTVRNKIATTNLERYGTIAPAQNENIKQQTKESNLKKYGVESPMQLLEVQQYQQNVIFEKYGVKHPIQNQLIAEKTKNTNIERYGYDNPSKSPIIINKIRQEQLSTFYKKLIDRLDVHHIMPLSTMDDFDFIQNQTQWVCKECSTIFDGTAINGRIPRCPTCYPKHISAGQTEVINYLVSLLGKDDISINNRDILIDKNDNRRNRELDILIQSKSFAIEYCGLRWHTEIFGNKPKTYHHLKWKDCNEHNLQLLTIFSDEWYDKKKLLQSMIAIKLGIANRVYARKTKIIQISSEDANKFFESNHINGYVNSSINLALSIDNVLVMCMSLSKPRYNKLFDYEITRMATIHNTVVVGGVSKLFNYFIRTFSPKSVISYCDLRYGTGKSYLNIGFIKYRTPTIGYQYVEIDKPYIRYDRLRYQKHKLGDTNGLTEQAYMLQLGYDRLWDCGHQKFVWYNKNNYI